MPPWWLAYFDVVAKALLGLFTESNKQINNCKAKQYCREWSNWIRWSSSELNKLCHSSMLLSAIELTVARDHFDILSRVGLGPLSYLLEGLAISIPIEYLKDEGEAAKPMPQRYKRWPQIGVRPS